jgi:hypothetical protein
MTSEIESTDTDAANATRSRRIIRMLSDWLELLSGPPSPVFTAMVKRRDWTRALNLMFLSLTFSGVALGVNFGLAGFLTSPTQAVLTTKPLIYVLLSSVVLATAYSFVASPLRVKINIQQIFFILISLCLPWLPILIFVDAIRYLPSFPLIFLVNWVGLIIVLLKAMSNFVKGVTEVSQAPKWRVWLTVAGPLIVILILIFRMYG